MVWQILLPAAISAVSSWWAGKQANKKVEELQEKILNKQAEGQALNKLEKGLATTNSHLKTLTDKLNAAKLPQESIEEQKSSINLPKNTYQKIEESLSDLGDRVDKLSKRDKLEILEQVKTASPEERKRIMEELKAQTNAEVEATNKVLKEQMEKLEKNNLKLADELRQAKESNDPQKMAQILSMMKDNDKNQQATRLALKKMAEHKAKQHKAIQEYVQHIDDPWYKDINWTSPITWFLVLIVIGSFIGSWFAIKWVWNKFKGTLIGT